MAYGFHVHPKEYTADVRGFSFVIERDGDLYKAYKSGKGLTFEDDDASEVIQSAVSQVSDNGGGCVFLRSALYELKSDIEVYDNVELLGEGYRTVDKEGGTILSFSDTSSLIVKGTSDQRRKGVKISNLLVKGNIVLKYCAGVELSNLIVNAEGREYGIWIDSSWTVTLSRIVVKNCTYGMYVHNSESGASRSTVQGERINLEDNEYGIYSDEDINHQILISNAWIEPKYAFRGYSIQLSCARVVSNTEAFRGNELFIENVNVFGDRSAGNTAFHVNSWGTLLFSGRVGNFNIVFALEGNSKVNAHAHISGCDNLFNIISSPVRAYIKGNLISIESINAVPDEYIFEGYTNSNVRSRNSGVATFSGDGSTTEFKIEHGLVSAPSKYGVSPLTPDAHADKTISVDSTYIIITFSTAPPSGTDNLKFSWWAEV